MLAFVKSNKVNLPVMNKQMMIIGAVVVAILVAASAAYLVMSSNKSAGDDSMMSEEKMSEDSMMSKSSIKGLLGTGKNVTCTIKYSENSSAGTIYVAGERMRGDFTTAGVSEESHMINDGEYSWVWTGSQGFKSKIDDTKMDASPAPASGDSKEVDLNKEVDMDCSSWSVDESMLTPPADVKFTDATSMMESMQEQTQTTPKMDPSVCDRLTDPQAKAACMSAVGQ